MCKKMHEWNKGKWVFFDIYSLGYPFYYIHPYKQQAVKHITENVPLYIDYVIVFGSSIGTWHRCESDLDLCVIGLIDKFSSVHKQRFYYKNVDLNVLMYESLSDLCNYETDINHVRYAILNEGVMVYEKI